VLAHGIWMMTPDGNKVVGHEGRAIRDYRGFIWTPDGKLYLPGYGSGAICINRAGTFAAGGVNYNVTAYPALWNANTQELVLTLSLPGEFWGVSDDGNTLLLFTARYGYHRCRAEIWDRVHNTFRTLPPYQSDPHTFGFKLTPDGAIAVGTSGELYDNWLGVGLELQSRDVACVDDADLLAVLFAFGQTGSELGRVDVNCDGVVDDADLLQVLFNFGSGC
jgi:hypothetical protein